MYTIRTLLAVFILVLPGALFAQTPVYVDGAGTYTPVKSSTATVFTADQTLGDGADNTSSKRLLFVADDTSTDFTGGVNVPQDSSGYGPCLTFSTPDQSDGSITEVMLLYLEEGAGALYFTPDGAIDIGEDGFLRPNNYFGAGNMTVAGNVVGKRADYAFIPIEWCHDGSTAPAAAVEVANGNGATQVRDFGTSAGDVNDSVICPWGVPDDIVAGSGIKYRPVVTVTNATGPGATEGTSFWLSGYSSGDNDPLTGTYGTEVEVNTADAVAVQYDWLLPGYSGVVTITDLAAGEQASLLFERDQGDTQDDYNQAIGVSGFWIKFERLTAGF